MSWSCQLPSCNSFTHHMHILFTWETPLVNPWPTVHLFTLFSTSFTCFYLSLFLCSLLHLSHFIIQLTALCSARPERLTTSPPLWAKYFGWVCAGPCLLKIKHQRSSTFTLLLISRSYWFDKPWFVIEGKLLLATSTPSLGAQPNAAITDRHQFFWHHFWGTL